MYGTSYQALYALWYLLLLLPPPATRPPHTTATTTTTLERLTSHITSYYSNTDEYPQRRSMLDLSRRGAG